MFVGPYFIKLALICYIFTIFLLCSVICNKTIKIYIFRKIQPNQETNENKYNKDRKLPVMFNNSLPVKFWDMLHLLLF